MKITFSAKEKQALLAVGLCMSLYIIIPFILVRFFPQAAEFLKQSSILLMMAPGLLLYTTLALYSRNFFLAKNDFCHIPFANISKWSSIMIAVNMLGTFLWMKLLDLLKLQFDTFVPIEDFLKKSSLPELIIAGIYICILTPAIEETIFRRVIFEGLRERCPQVFSMTLASLLFAALHGILFQLFSLFLLGGYFQILYCRDHKLGSSIYAHFFNNSFAFIMLVIVKYYVTGI